MAPPFSAARKRLAAHWTATDAHIFPPAGKDANIRPVSDGARARLIESLQAFRAVFANPRLRRLELALIGSVTGEWAYAIALAVYAFDRGGAAAVGLVGLIRFFPSALAAPFAAVLGDRFSRVRVMVVADLLRALAMIGAALAALGDAPAGIVYALAGVVAVVSMAFRPAQAALLPALARTPGELTAANVASTTIESIGSFAGPALGGLLLAATNAGTVFAVTAAAFVWSAILVLGIESSPPERTTVEAGGIVTEALAGFRAILGEARLRLVVALYAAQTLVAGGLNVLIVVVAFELLDLGTSGPGLLNAAVGVGGLLGALVALALVGRQRLASDFGLGLLLWGIPIALIGVWPHQATALVLLAVLGIGNTLVDVAALTLLQRAAPNEVLARVFGVIESLLVGAIGLGAILAPVLVSLFGADGALIATGVFLAVLSAVSWPQLARIDRDVAVPERELALLTRLPLFAPLPPATVEHLARSLVPLTMRAGEEIVREGEPGDRFYVVASGAVEAAAEGQPLRMLGVGEYFGEIALLRSVPRTATVVAREDGELLTLDRDEFVAAVTGHPESREAADAVIGARLGTLRAGMASL
jgi:MFS family permease